MKPFNLEAAKRGEPLITRDGAQARFVAYVPESVSQKVYAVMSGVVLAYNDDGTFHLDGGARYSPWDLFMQEPPKVEKWVNLYPEWTAAGWGQYGIHDSEAAADRGAGKDRLGGKAHRIEV